MTTVPRNLEPDVWNGTIQSASDAFIDAIADVSQTMKDAQPKRTAAANQAAANFSGFYADEFATACSVQTSEYEQFVSSLDSLKTGLRDAQEGAKQEQARRQRAREWKEAHDDWERRKENAVWDTWWELFNSEPEISTEDLRGGEAPRIAGPANPGTKETSHGSRHGACSRSSASPSDLEAYVDTVGPLNDDLSRAHTKMMSTYVEFLATWTWAEPISNPIDGFTDFATSLDQHRQNNVNDATWISAVAEAFRKAGGAGAVVSLSDMSLAAAILAAGAHSDRQQLDVPVLSLNGMVPTTGYADDPVNTVTGNFAEPEEDLRGVGAASDLRLERTYNSWNTAAGAFGLGWTSVLDQSLRFGEDDTTWLAPNGRHVTFPLEECRPSGPDAPGGISSGRASYGRARGAAFWLVPVADVPAVPAGSVDATCEPALGEASAIPVREVAQWAIVDHRGCVRWFDRTGAWLGTTRESATVRAERTMDGRVLALVHSRGRSIALQYADQVVTSATASWGLTVTYSYESGRLVAATGPQGTRRYVWNTAGLIERVISAAGVTEVSNTYDADGRVQFQVSQYGRRSRYSYLPGLITEVADVDASRANVWVSDTHGRLLRVTDSDGNTQRMVYNRAGDLIAVTERDGRFTAHRVDERGREVRRTLPDGGVLNFEWDEQDRLCTLTTSAGGTVTFEYRDNSVNPVAMRNPLGGITRYEWADGLLTAMTDPTGVRIEFAYDAYGDLCALTDGAGHTWRIERDEAGNVTRVVTPLGHSANFSYDAHGQFTVAAGLDGQSWTLTRDEAGRISGITTPTGETARLTYGADGAAASAMNPEGAATSMTRDDLGNLNKLKLPGGLDLSVTYDALSRLRTITGPEGETWEQSWDVNGRPTTWTDPTGRTAEGAMPSPGRALGPATMRRTTVTRDSFGRITGVEDEAGQAELVTYDAAGNVVEAVNGEGYLTRYRRDTAGRVIARISPEGRTTTYRYDARGLLSAVVDPAGGETLLEHDADGRLIAVVTPEGERSTWEYDAAGRVVCARPAGAGKTVVRYNADGRVEYMRDPVHGARTFTYTAAGRIASVENGVGGTTRYEYDAAGNRVAMVDPIGARWTCGYDAWGRQVSATDPLGNTVRLEYDAAGRPIKRTDATGSEFAVEYDAAGRLAETRVDGRTQVAVDYHEGGRRVMVRDYTHPAGAQVTHEVVKDRRGLPVARTTTVDGKETRWAWTYDRDGLLTEVSLDGDAWRYEYDQAGRLRALVAPSGARAEVSTDRDGRVRCVDAGFTMRAWDYRQGFPVRMEVDGASEERTYDAWGRLAGLRNGNGSFGFTYDAANQLTGVTGPEGARRFSYDAAGRLVRVAAGTAESTFAYDRTSRRVARTTPEGEVAYTFDAGGRRVATQTANAVQRIEWDGRGWPSQVKLTGLGTTTGTHENNVTVPVWVNGLGEPTELGGSRFDWNIAAPVPQLMRAGGARVWHLPGGAVQRDGVLPKGVTVAGGRLSVGGMGWMGTRLADLASFAFVSPDPAVPAPGSLWEANTYNLLGNNPLNLVDPWGTAPITDADLSAIDAYNENRNNAGQRWANIGVGLGAVALMAVGAAILTLNPGTLIATLAIGAVGGAVFGASSSIFGQILGGTNFQDLDWKHIGVDAALGAVGGALGGAVGRTVGQVTEAAIPEISGMRQTITGSLADQLPRNALSSGVSGAINGSAPAIEQVSDGKGLNSQLLISGMANGAVSGLFGGSVTTTGGVIATSGMVRAGLSEAVSNKGGQLIGGGIAGAFSGGAEYAVTSQLPGADPYSDSDLLGSVIIGGIGGGTPGYEPAIAGN